MRKRPHSARGHVGRYAGDRSKAGCRANRNMERFPSNEHSIWFLLSPVASFCGDLNPSPVDDIKVVAA